MATVKQPEARVVSEVCSMCGLDWKRHGSKPTTETCIRLLAADLAVANERANRVTINPFPVYPYRPYWGTVYPNQLLTCGGSATIQSGGQATSAGYVQMINGANSITPALASSVPHPIAA